MSTAESTTTSQTPVQEALDRAAESFPAFLLPRLVGVDHLWKSLGSARKRVDDGHTMQMKKLAETLGFEGQENAAASEDDMGGISVAGDTHITITPPPEKPTPATVEKAKSWLPAIALAVSMLGGGTGLGLFLSHILKPQPAAQQSAVPNTDTDTDTVMVIDFPEG